MDYAENKPISAWGYLGYDFLFAIPVVGLISALVLAIGARNQNVKNFARSQFCFVLVLIVVYCVAAAIGIDFAG
jgi:phosphoglycerol transferase MdoB-like AlkP superfamily enzyme